MRCLPDGKALSCCSRHHSYSSSVSPFHAKTGVPPAAMAAAAWSCVEKMLQDDHVISAPRYLSVSIRTAVWMAIVKQVSQMHYISSFHSESILMCRQPAILAPFNGWSSLYLILVAIKPGISCSASSISLLPKAARLMSATLYVFAGSPMFAIVL